ncbi:MAG: fatty acid kinase fatty acid binding subunit [Mycobacterium sp.]|jgi:DegV family protein with EDD domain|nr:fatty acid kinase fatty acid binding subunit [Mycobacterium sp.]
MAVVVVTDSSSRLCDDDLEKWRIRQVPLHILVGGEDFRDGVDAVPSDIHSQPKATTAGATPAELSDVYRQALSDSGGDGVVAVHISAALSSTLTSAEQAARQFSGAVRVVNSRSAAMATGFVALAAARAAADGLDLDAVEAEAVSGANRVRGYVVVHRLDNLRRGGRIGRGESWLSTALAIKPLLRMDSDGRLVLVQRVRTAGKALDAMVEQVVAEVGNRSAFVAVHHIDNPAAANNVAHELIARLHPCEPPTVTEMGPVLGVHLGAGAVGVCVDIAD